MVDETRTTTSRKPTGERRRQVADAALEIIARDGISSLTTTTLARAVGVTPGALFRHFRSIEEILELAVERAVEELAQTYPPAGAPPIERILAFAEARMALARRKLGIPRLVLSDQFARALPASARAALTRAVVESAAFVTAVVAEGQRDGSIRADLEPQALAVVVLGAIQMSILRATILPGDLVGAPDVGETLRVLLSSLPSKGRS
jgi:AcrR family transcriptional regulator